MSGHRLRRRYWWHRHREQQRRGTSWMHCGAYIAAIRIPRKAARTLADMVDRWVGRMTRSEKLNPPGGRERKMKHPRERPGLRLSSSSSGSSCIIPSRTDQHSRFSAPIILRWVGLSHDIRALILAYIMILVSEDSAQAFSQLWTSHHGRASTYQVSFNPYRTICQGNLPSWCRSYITCYSTRLMSYQNRDPWAFKLAYLVKSLEPYREILQFRLFVVVGEVSTG